MECECMPKHTVLPSSKAYMQAASTTAAAAAANAKVAAWGRHIAFAGVRIIRAHVYAGKDGLSYIYTYIYVRLFNATTSSTAQQSVS